MTNIEIIRQMFTHKKMLKFDEIRTRFCDLSEISLRKYLKTLGAQSSVNENSRFYILPHEHEFDEHDLLRLRQVRFHREGTLLNAIVSLVESSECGLKRQDLAGLLLTPVDSQLPGLFKRGLLSREGGKGRKGYVYYSADATLATKQEQLRAGREDEALIKANELSAESKNSKREKISKDDVIAVLKTLLDNPDYSTKSIALSLQKKGFKHLNTEQVKEIAEVYEIEGKKF
jgi:hypothetical protein